MKISNIIFLNFLFLGTMITISAYSWFSMWIGLEINLLSFIPLINKKNSPSSEASLKYFIIQMISSMIILFSILIMFLETSFLKDSILPQMIMNSALLMKLGAAPFHFWFVEIIMGLEWKIILILLTWQKLAPMVLLMYSFSNKMFLILVILTSLILSSVLSWNQTDMKKILAYSSINHMGWLLSILLMNQTNWLIYFMIYSFLNISLISMFINSKSKSIPMMVYSLNNNKKMKFFFCLNLMSLGGLPPFLGFFPKWMILLNLMDYSFFLSMIMVIMSLIMLFTYIRLTLQSLTIKSTESKMMFKKNWMMPNFFSYINMMGLVMFTLIMNF